MKERRLLFWPQGATLRTDVSQFGRQARLKGQTSLISGESSTQMRDVSQIAAASEKIQKFWHRKNAAEMDLVGQGPKIQFKMHFSCLFARREFGQIFFENFGCPE